MPVLCSAISHHSKGEELSSAIFNVSHWWCTVLSPIRRTGIRRTSSINTAPRNQCSFALPHYIPRISMECRNDRNFQGSISSHWFLVHWYRNMQIRLWKLVEEQNSHVDFLDAQRSNAKRHWQGAPCLLKTSDAYQCVWTNAFILTRRDRTTEDICGQFFNCKCFFLYSVFVFQHNNL